MQIRPPIVAVLGHVDHGKTSLLDAIRNTNVQTGETGGITQHIGAYQVKHNDRLITFIDTPGHAAFTAMRARGGKIADIAILVVAADDGVMPQTKESISHIKAAGIPMLVAINKVDLPSADVNRTKVSLAEAEVFVEGQGGSTPVVEVSATKKQGLDDLLETLLLLADLEEIKADPQGTLKAYVIESFLDKRQGPLCTLVVKEGTIKPLETLSTTNPPRISAKIKSMSDWQGNEVKEAPPSTPVQILGFNDVPPVGSLITHEKDADSLKEENVTTSTTKSITPGSQEENRLNIILKSDYVGTLEAILGNLPDKTQVIYAGTGPVTESDVLLAETTNSIIYGFRVEASNTSKKLATTESVKIKSFDTIYDLMDDIKVDVGKGTQIILEEITLGQAKVLKIFNLPDQKIIGAVVSSGKIKVGDKLKVEKADGTKKIASVVSLKQGKSDKQTVKKDQEFGVVLNPSLDVHEGDILTSFTTKPDN